MLGKLFKTKTPTQDFTFTAPLAPDDPFYVIGDVHGCADILEALLNKIGADSPLGAKTKIIFVGDYIDRGEQSAMALRWIKSLSEDPDFDVTCLIGNHEDMLLKFLDDPVERGARWLRYGGLQTLASFGVGAISETSSYASVLAARDNLQEAMGPDLIAWLKALPLFVVNGNIAVVHAAADPNLHMSEQDPRVLKWGHKDFFKQPRADDVWVVHGHTIVDVAEASNGRVAVDTGAYATGRLTAACIEPGTLRYLHT